MSSTSDTQPSFLFPAPRHDNSNGVPKSPKSPKILTIENPLLKRPQFMLGATQMATTANQNQPRSPLASLSVNISQLTTKSPGPPPKASLSLMSMSVSAPTEAMETTIDTGFGQSKLTSSRDNTPITPPPVNSPRLLHQSPVLVNQRSDFPSCDSGNWVVSYGYANREEYKELERILTSYGAIIDSQANANWLAIKYESRLAAEKALCSQPIKLSSNSLCGTVRGSSQLLQTLRAQQPNDSLKSVEHGLSAVKTKGKEMTLGSAGLSEEDILAQYDVQDQYDSDWRHAGSICEKVLAWLFGWDNILPVNKPHAD
ncbi:unnamed protein product [Cylindrotheca closterium]|uniref:RRM Nup35-type domain-containing protein n=1 Tax=Cylindrotheca closterium TaxID=2856 RepID=A0AAD2CT25_9STRA|nr:unnamed protein product [Cylindrotheca closterium]